MNIKTEIENIKTDWKDILLDIYKDNSVYFSDLQEYLNQELEKYNGLLEIYPPANLIFNCFNFFNFNDMKVVLIGQDPYHGPNQAMGLSFSVSKNIKVPPSLKRIYKEIETDLNININKNTGDLTRWANQGVLLLNTALTVRQSKPSSHSKYWIKFTDLIIKYINQNSDKLVFLLWGNHAKKYKEYLDLEKHYILEASHPSPLARTGWFGCKHFSKTNQLLKNNNKNEINWEN
jgi:uracil-DNA glycosylase